MSLLSQAVIIHHPADGLPGRLPGSRLRCRDPGGGKRRDSRIRSATGCCIPEPGDVPRGGGGGWEKPDLNLRGPAETPRNSALGGVRVVWEAGELKWDDRVSDWLDVGAQVFHLIVCVLT